MVDPVLKNESVSRSRSKYTLHFAENTLLAGNIIAVILVQVLSESVASALTFLDDDRTQETRKFIRMMDSFFDCLNVKSPKEGVFKRKDFRLPYKSPTDVRFSVSSTYTKCYAAVRKGTDHVNYYFYTVADRCILGIP